MRTKNSIRNITISLFGQVLTIFVAFFSRSIFLKYLGADYLGLNGLFSNILSILSLVDLGIGPAIIFSLYKPLAENDEKTIAALISFYKKVYLFIGISILALGILITPFINFFINGDVSVDVNLYIVFILFLCNTSFTYFMSYKKNLLIADQKQYIVDFVQNLFQLLVAIVRIIILMMTRNYYLYLIIQIISVILDNLYINYIVNKKYDFIIKHKEEKIKKDVKKEIIKNTKAMIFDKIGGIAVSSTDNLLISKLINLASVGMYSNYYLIISSLKKIINQIFHGVTASVGNFCVTNSKQKSMEIFNTSYFVSYIIYSFSSCCLLCLFNPFIELWLGKEYVFSLSIVIVLVINFYLNGMRSATSVFNNAFGLYWYQRYRPLIEAVLNLAISIVLGLKYGVVGIFIGTTITTITCCTLVEPYIVFKYGFERDSKEYYKQYIVYLFLTTLLASFCFILCTFIKINGILGFGLKLLLCSLIPNIINLLIFKNQEEYLYLQKTFVQSMKSIFHF